MGTWSVMGDVVITLTAAVSLGALLQFLGQSRIVGYLLAGLIIGGPGSLHLINHINTLQAIAEIGVTLLLFTIGLDFSIEKLRTFGATAAIGGAIQVLATLTIVAVAMHVAGLSNVQALAIGMVVSLSSTAVVLRILADRAELDSTHGYAAVGILLVQDIALIPFLLLMPDLGKSYSIGFILQNVGESLLKVAGLAIAMWVVDRVLVTHAFYTAARGSERQELLTIMSLLVAMAAAWATHEMGLSAALGAFIAGALVGNAAYADHVKAEISAVRVIFSTLFLASIGMLADFRFLSSHVLTVLYLAGTVIVGKSIIATASLLLAKSTTRAATLAGVGVSQLGEFSFVLAVAAHEAGAISNHQFQMLISLSLVTMLVTPYTISISSPLYAMISGRRQQTQLPESQDMLTDHAVVVGYGPAGERVCEELGDAGHAVFVVELNPASCERARALGYRVIHGDASRSTILDKASLGNAQVVIITLPDTRQTTAITRTIRNRHPDLRIVARGRYHLHLNQLTAAGANATSDEEVESGSKLAQLALDSFGVAP